MKRLFLAATLIFTLLISCTKDVGEQYDQIVYMDQNLNYKIIRSYTTDINHPYCYDVPIPQDSSIVFELDIDKDSQADFKITVKHFRSNNIVGGHSCPYCYNKQVIISTLSSNAFLSVEQKDNHHSRNYNETELIQKSDAWTRLTTCVFWEGGISGTSISFQTPYLGLKIKGQLCWIKIQKDSGITILGWGYNKTTGRSIMAGQKN